ncbi:putative cytosolic iron-sulfur protein assembly protein CIAO1-like protein [Hypsibius exemplaris]|uniref:Probable cytosolic iron-sulfur protein assembly protein CIAO1 homolog n=1 Tax=Hypsibius exemplaris TaxID=2072580 RepID=A0A1W0WSI0_HYPEX|nr:putative cytosolic iron-sulfur protein assembly protein CIAO1-like protein [Hypsibius exemplaris]
MSSLKLLQDLVAHDDRVWCVKWNPTGTLLASCGSDKKIVLWGEEEGKWVAKVHLTEAHERTIRAVAWSPTGTYLASCSFDKTICIWKRDDTGVFGAIATLEGHENEVKCVAWSVSGEYLASCSRDKTVWIWSCEYDDEYDCLSVLHSHSQDVKKICWSPVEDVLVSCSYDNTVKCFKDDGDDWTCTDTLTGHESTVWAVAFDGTGKRLVTCSDDRTVKIWQRFNALDNSASQKPGWHCVCTLSGYHDRAIFDVDWSAIHGAIVSTGADDCIRIFEENLTAQDPLREPEFFAAASMPRAHSQDVNAVSWNPVRGHLLASCSDDGLVKIWTYARPE